MNARRARPSFTGYNLVEVLVTLTIVSIITITLVSFVNDLDMRHKVAVARADINRIAEAAHLAEAEMSRVTTLPGQSLELLNLTTTSKLAWLLGSKLLELPSEDPWGNRFIRVEQANSVVAYVRATEATDVSTGTPYIVDEGLGRVVCAGPDGIVDTHIGQDPADSEADLIVEYRHKPWLFYNVGGKLFINSADGSANPTSVQGIEVRSPDATRYTNAQVAPDGLRYAAVKNGNTLVIGTLTWATETGGVNPTSRADEVILAPRNHSLSFELTGWTSGVVPSVDEGTFPLWLPDSSGVVFLAGGDLYRYSQSRGKQSGPDRGEVLLLARGTQLSDDASAGSSSRILNSTRRFATYLNPDKSLFLAVAADGKVAYRTGTGGIRVVLGDGTARRELKPLGDLAPIAWPNSNYLIYWNRANKTLYRIAQDGSADGPLVVDPTQKIEVTAMYNASLSPEGTYLAFLVSPSKGYILRSDGNGPVIGPGPNDLFFGGLGGGMQYAPPFRWRQALDCASYRVLYLSSSNLAHPIQNLRFDLHDHYPFSNAVGINDPEGCELSAGSLVSFQSTQEKLLDGLGVQAYDLSRDEKLLAIVSDKDARLRPGSGSGGLYIVPVTGRSQASTRIALPAGWASVPYSYVSWLLN